MVRKFRSSFALAALGFLVASCASSGSIERGQRFGVQIGTPLDDARTVLRRRGFQDELPITNQELPGCGDRSRQQGEEVSAFSSPRLGLPLVCLFVVSGRVAAIAWEYTVP